MSNEPILWTILETSFRDAMGDEQTKHANNVEAPLQTKQKRHKHGYPVNVQL